MSRPSKKVLTTDTQTALKRNVGPHNLPEDTVITFKMPKTSLDQFIEYLDNRQLKDTKYSAFKDPIALLRARARQEDAKLSADQRGIDVTTSASWLYSGD